MYSFSPKIIKIIFYHTNRNWISVVRYWLCFKPQLDDVKITEMMEAVHHGSDHHVPTNSAETIVGHKIKQKHI